MRANSAFVIEPAQSWKRLQGAKDVFILGKDDESPVLIEADTGPQHPDAVLPWRRISLNGRWGSKSEPCAM